MKAIDMASLVYKRAKKYVLVCSMCDEGGSCVLPMWNSLSSPPQKNPCLMEGGNARNDDGDIHFHALLKLGISHQLRSAASNVHTGRIENILHF